MALIGANELKKKMLIEVEGQPYNILDVFFATPTARGASTMVRTRLKNLLNGAVLEKTFRTSEKFPEPDVDLAGQARGPAHGRRGDAGPAERAGQPVCGDVGGARCAPVRPRCDRQGDR